VSVRLKGLGPATLARIDHKGKGEGDRIYLYDDWCVPTYSAAHMNAYTKRVQVLAGVKVDVKKND
jgi:hypothetical protein